MRQRIHKSAFLCLLIGTMVFCAVFPVLAQKTTEQKLAQTADAIKQLQAGSAKAKEKLDAAKKEQSAIGERLDELNRQMEDVQLALEGIETRLAKKNDQIAKTEDELQEMEEKRAARYEAMKVRIRFMYENSDSSALQLLLGANSMGEFLNRIEYFSQVVAYDRAQLEEYHMLLDGLEEKKQLYETQKEELVTLRQEQKEQLDRLSGIVAETKKDLKAAGVAAEAAEDALNDVDGQLQAQLDYEEKLEAQKAAEDKARMEEIKRQEEELKRKRAEEEARRRAEEERRRAEEEAKKNQETEEGDDAGGTEENPDDMKDTDLPSSAEDLELLACIIQCEADGEPYAGKLAVGSVVMNRVVSSSFPNTVMGVIYQSGQFSPVASGRMAARVAAGANSTCRQAAQEVLGGNITVPYLYFCRDNGTIDGHVIGHHVFY